MRSSVAALMACVVSLGGVAVGCGPSFAAVHEGESRFEHCYALDENPNETLEKKAACWSDWAQRHTYGQTRDRVQYAVQRHRALSRVPNLPTDEAMMSAAPGEGVQPQHVSAPAPTSAFAPPPKTLEADGGSDAAPGTRLPESGVVAPAPAYAPPKSMAVACAYDCESTWTGCRSGCDKKRCEECDRTYKTCLRKCAK